MTEPVTMDTVFTNPEILDRALYVRQQFNLGKDNPATLYETMEKLLIAQGEWDFEQEVKDHPYAIEVEGLGTPEFAANKEEGVLAWLKRQFSESDYIFMPRNAMGKYKDRWNWIFFRKKDQAMLFKLTWL